MKAMVARTLTSRMRGLLGRGRYPYVLLLTPCNDVHTFGMRYAIDVAFISAEGVVLESCRKVCPCRRLRCREAYATLERITSDEPWPSRGEQVEIQEINHVASNVKRRKSL